MASKPILVASSMNGGAEAIAPVANRLCERAHVWLAGAAKRNAMDFSGKPALLDSYGRSGIWQALFDLQPKAILTGTQVQEKGSPDPIEHMLWELSRRAHVRTVAVMDTWGNELERFSDLDLSAETPLQKVTAARAHMPSMIAAIDRYQKAEMVRLGFPANRISVTGNPYFEKVAQEFAQLSPGTREALLRRPVFSRFDPSAKTIVFMSDSIEGAYPDIGFTEKSVLQSFLALADRLAKDAGIKLNIIVRPHPFRNQNAAAAFDCDAPGIAKVLHNPVSSRGNEPENEYSMEELLFAADLVVGTFNNPLVTAKIVGKPVIHWLPGIAPGYDFQLFMSEQGMSHRITDGGELGEIMLRKTVLGLLDGSLTQKSMGAVEGATDRVLDLLG